MWVPWELRDPGVSFQIKTDVDFSQTWADFIGTGLKQQQDA